MVHCGAHSCDLSIVWSLPGCLTWWLYNLSNSGVYVIGFDIGLGWGSGCFIPWFHQANLLVFLQSLVHKLETTLNLETDTSEIVNEIIYTVRKAGRVSIVGVYAGFAKWVSYDDSRTFEFKKKFVTRALWRNLWKWVLCLAAVLVLGFQCFSSVTTCGDVWLHLPAISMLVPWWRRDLTLLQDRHLCRNIGELATTIQAARQLKKFN
jgi:hypothetical protein